MDGLQAEQTARLAVPDTVLLGLVQGPAELLPISSSAHINVVPWLAGWSYVRLDPELRKSVEVTLHAGTAVALLIGQRHLMREELKALDGRRPVMLIASFLPPALVGLAFERPIERHLGGPGAIACGLVAGALAMALADRTPVSCGNHREADWRDGLALGLAQAAALMPGVSRNGATLAAARRRGFSREDANLLSRLIALPVIGGAALLKGLRLFRRGVDRPERAALAAGFIASVLSTLASQRLIRMVERDRALWPYAAYRLALAAMILLRLKARAPRPGLQDS